MLGMQLQNVYAADIIDTEEFNLEKLDVMDIVNIEDTCTNAALIQAYTNKIQSLSDSEFNEMIAEMMENTTDIYELRDKLAMFDVELGTSEADDCSLMTLEDTDVNFTNYYAKRGGDSFYRLFIKMTFDAQEFNPGSLDGLVTYFDPDMSEYFGYDILAEDAFTLRSDRSKDDGYITFNFHDELLHGVGYQDAYTVVMHVIPLVSGQYIDYGAELGHSYTENNISISGSIGITLPKTFGGEIGFEANQGEEYWQVSSGSSTFIDR